MCLPPSLQSQRVAPLPKHPDKGLRAVIESALRQRWAVSKGQKYYMMKCPCPMKHKKTVKISPSNPKYERELRHFLERYTCWKEER